MDFNQRGNHTGKQVVMRFYDTDHPDDVYEDASFTVYAGINRIDTSYLHTYSSQDQTAYYFWGNEYSFSYFADPVVNRNLEVVATQNGSRIEMWNDVSDGISQGTIGFRPVSTSENSVIKLRIYDPDSSTATYKNCQFKVSTPRISDISVYGLEEHYPYDPSTLVYNSIGFYADPSIHRPLVMDLSTGGDIIEWYMSDRTEDAGVFNFRMKDRTKEGVVSFRLYDSLFTGTYRDVSFMCYQFIDEILFNGLQNVYSISSGETGSLGFYAVPNVIRNLDVSVTEGYGNITYSVHDVVDSSGLISFDLRSGVTETSVGVRVSDPLDDTVYSDASFVVARSVTIQLTGVQDNYICDQWYQVSFDTVPHVNRHMDISVYGPDEISWNIVEQSGSGGVIEFIVSEEDYDINNPWYTIVISDPLGTDTYTQELYLQPTFSEYMFYYEETASYDITNFPERYPSGYELNAQYVTDSYGNSYWNTHPQADPSGNVIEYTWHFNRNTEYNNDPDYGERIIPSIVMADQNDYTNRYAYVVNTSLPDFKLCFTGLNHSDYTVTLRLSDAYSDNYIDHTIKIYKNCIYYVSAEDFPRDIIIDSSQYYRIDPSDINKQFSLYSYPYPMRSMMGFHYRLSENSNAIVYDTSDLLEYVESGNITIPVKYGEAFNFSIRDVSKYTDPSIHLEIKDNYDGIYPGMWNTNWITKNDVYFQIYYPLTSIRIVPKAEIIPNSPLTTINELQDSSIMPALHNYYSSTNERYFPDEAVFQSEVTGLGNEKEWGI